MTLTKKQLRMLNVIKAQTRRGAPVSASTVALELGVSKSSAQAMMWRLAELGMLWRPRVVVEGRWEVSLPGNRALNESGAD